MKIYNFLEVSASFDLAPDAAIEHFRSKGLRTTFAWQDMIGEEHDAAFTVAKMLDTDLLATVRDKLDRHLATGGTLAEFKREMIPTLQKAGWWGKKDIIDPATGKVVTAQLGSASRLENIFRTNMQSAYSVGRWDMIQKNAAAAPYLMYDAVDDGRVRPEHNAIDNTVLPVTNAFWDEFMPPNGWGCRCGVIQLDVEELSEYGLRVSSPPKITRRRWINPRTGKSHHIPTTIDPGWNINPGKRRLGGLKDLEKEKRKTLTAKERKAVNKTPVPVLPPIQVGRPEYQPQKTAKAAAEWMVANDYADAADFGKLAPDIINDIGVSLSYHLTRFPELRKKVGFMGSMQTQNGLIYERMLNHYRSEALRLYPDRDPDALAKRWAKKPKANGRAWAHAMDSSDHRFYSGLHGVAFNEKFGSKRGLPDMLQGLKHSVDSEFHPVGTDAVRSIMDHELGHTLDYLLGVKDIPELRELWRQWAGDKLKLSAYARENIREFIAEAWAEYLNNPKPREVAKAVGEIIEKAYDEKFG